jgi:hypothetical protein
MTQNEYDVTVIKVVDGDRLYGVRTKESLRTLFL